ncbi:MAG: type II toxin-antitoxin system RelE family toxin [Anaerolineae bacterium]
MSLRLEWSAEATKSVRRLDRRTRAQLLAALDQLAETRQGDLIRLRPPLPGYRLRVGEWRVLVDLDSEAGTIVVHDVQPRGRAYRRR